MAGQKWPRTHAAWGVREENHRLWVAPISTCPEHPLGTVLTLPRIAEFCEPKTGAKRGQSPTYLGFTQWQRDTARLIAAAPELLDGCNALIGLIQIVAGRDDLPPEIRDALTSSHRLEEAKAAIAKAQDDA